MRKCPDCGVEPGARHKGGCDVERCARCGRQALSCNCVYEVNGIDPRTMEETHPEIYSDGATDEMLKKFDDEWGARAIIWNGVWPGVSECQEYGWYAKFTPGKGWQQCEKTDEGATEDLNRLYSTCVWNVETQKWVPVPEKTPA